MLVLSSLGLLGKESVLALALERSTSILRGRAVVGIFKDVVVVNVVACAWEIQVYVCVCKGWSAQGLW